MALSFSLFFFFPPGSPSAGSKSSGGKFSPVFDDPGETYILGVSDRGFFGVGPVFLCRTEHVLGGYTFFFGLAALVELFSLESH